MQLFGILLTTIFLLALIGVVLRFWKGIYFSRQVVIALVFTTLSFVALYFYQDGTLAMPGPRADLPEKVLAVIAITLTFNTVVELIKWVIVEYFILRRQMKFPVFVLNIFGWVAILIVSLLAVRTVFQVELTGVVVSSTIVSAAIGLALQDSLSSLLAGIILQVETPFSIGDWIEISGVEGKVVGQNWRTHTLQTRQDHYVLITNSQVAQEQIVNYSRPKVQALDAFIGVVYTAPPGDVKKVLATTLYGVEHIMDTPAPQFHVLEYADFSINYRIRFWIDDYEYRLEVHDEVMTRIWYALKRAGMGIPFPIRDVNMRIVPHDIEEITRRKDEAHIFDRLRTMALWEDLTDDQLHRLSSGSVMRYYTAGEYLVRQGEEGDSLFIIDTGISGIFIHKDGHEVRVDERGPGEFFGEMSLLTGQPRTASVVAETESQVITINKESFANILTADPAILELLLNALERRRMNMEEQMAAHKARKSSRDQSSERAALLSRITGFLGISVRGSNN
ncbi:MAG TPA: mechanosensitive ion channel family protein [Anaerolineae bacterium]|nr:mechanosensitive ion channel family protein [Anaerolineae bacterium]